MSIGKINPLRMKIVVGCVLYKDLIYGINSVSDCNNNVKSGITPDFCFCAQSAYKS